ncbi:MAG TPA: hypothetical protein VGD62_13205 [Acidobacteriaceae bacterium]
MATHEELVQDAAPPAERQTGICDLFLGITSLTDVDALRTQGSAAVAALAASLGAPTESLRVTLAYPGMEPPSDASSDSSAPQPGSPHLRLVSYALPGSDAATTPWAVAAASQRALLALAAESQAKACVLLNADLGLLAAGPLTQLALPVLEKRAELVLPIYGQGRYDSLLNHSILAPLTRALYGKRVHFPLASDYAISSRLVARLLQSAHSAAHANAGSILWPATVAATIDAPVAEAPVSLQHATRTEGLDLSTLISQLVGSVFADMEHNAPLWQRVRGSQTSLPSPAARLQLTPGDPGEHTPDPQPMIASFLLGWRSLQEVWGLVLPPVTLLELKRLTLVPTDRFRLPDELWARIIYDFALAYRLRNIGRTHLLGALTPLYLGWVASYVNEWTHETTPSHQQRHERLAKAFEDGKPYLVRRWRWPDRFNP